MLRLVTAGLSAAFLSMMAMGLFISGGPPSVSELVRMRAGLGEAYAAALHGVEETARRLREDYCAAHGCGRA